MITPSRTPQDFPLDSENKKRPPMSGRTPFWEGEPLALTSAPRFDDARGACWERVRPPGRIAGSRPSHSLAATPRF
ncbi:hypothetical protein GCM10028796_09550 [Ramlibacter monticola]